MQEIDKRISGIEDAIEQMDTSGKNNVKYKIILAQKSSGNLQQYEKTKCENNKNKDRKETQGKG